MNKSLEPSHLEELEDLLEKGTFIRELRITNVSAKNKAEMVKFFRTVANMGTVQDLVMRNNHCFQNFNEAWAMIAGLVRKSKFIQNLTISFSYMSDKHFAMIIPGLIGKNLVSVDLSGNFITLETLREFAEILKEADNLEELLLYNNTSNDFRVESIECLAECLPEKNKLNKFDVGGMTLTGLGPHLSKLVGKCPDLADLGLRNIRMNIFDYEELFKCLKEENSLKVLNISGNDTSNEENMEKLIEFVKETKIETLYVDDCGVTDEFSLQFIKAFKENNSIEELSFRNEEFDMYERLIDCCLEKDWFKTLILPKKLKNDKGLASKIVKVVEEEKIKINLAG